ncbi:hypothetical protein KCV01_g11903, partial [Aureobasidium melanogenum]
MGNRLTKIYTRTGDDGSTGLGDGSRTGKDAPRVAAYGTVDELNSAIGMVIAADGVDADIREVLVQIQHELFDLGGELCIPGMAMIQAGDIERLETVLDGFNADLPALKDFILPGGGMAASTCHLARTICRRAEREVVALARIEVVRPEAVGYLNRLSDLLILPQRRLLATAVALVIAGTAMGVQAKTPKNVIQPGSTQPVAETCPLGSFICPPRPVSYALCRPNAMLSFYEPAITKDTTLRDTSPTDVHSGIDDGGKSGVKVESPEPNVYHMTGGVRLERADQVLRADDVTYNSDSTAYDAEGNVRYQEAGMLVSADRMTGTTTPNQGEAEHVRYQLLQSRGNGVAEHATVMDPQHGRFRMATYSTCDVGSRMWEFRAKTMNLNKETGVGVARSGTLRFKNVPIMYLPYFTFPLDDRRKSGFLYPTFGSSSHSGAYLSTPYYLNLAPNYDATLDPRYYSDRGFMLGAEFRYLLPRTNGTFYAQYMANDKGPDEDISHTSDRDGSKQRYLVQVTNSTDLGGGYRFAANINHASDNQYFRDFSNDLYSSAIGLLSSSAYVSKGGKYWGASLGVDDYQNVDAGLPNYVIPYRRWPRATFSLDVPVSSWLEVGMSSEAVAFRKLDRQPINPNPLFPGQVDGNRLDLAPFVAADFSGASWFVRPRLEYRYTGYQLDSDYQKFNYTQRTPSRSLPVASLDTGLIFDRQTHLFGTNYTQTLEPRLYYLYVPYRNQNNLPLFDTSEMSFDFWQLFTTNRFSGADRQM